MHQSCLWVGPHFILNNVGQDVPEGGFWSYSASGLLSNLGLWSLPVVNPGYLMLKAVSHVGLASACLQAACESISC